MALDPGNIEATTGMAKAIFEQLKAALEPDLAGLEEKDMEPIRNGWKKMAYAVSRGVVDHLIANLEIAGIRTTGDVAASVAGDTGTGGPDGHVHVVNLKGNQTGLVCTQSNDGTGRVR